MTTDTAAMVARLDAVSLLVRDARDEHLVDAYNAFQVAALSPHPPVESVEAPYRWPVLREAWTRPCPYPHNYEARHISGFMAREKCSCGNAFTEGKGRVPLPWAELLRYDGAVRGVLEEALEAGGWSLGPLLPVGPTAWEAHLITPEGSQGYRGHGPTKALARLAATEQALGA
jgi:hypothetical protein